MLALIAGQGRLPVLLARRLAADGAAFQVFEMAGYPFDNPEALVVSRFRIEHLGSLLDRLVAGGFSHVCFAGSIRRPQIDLTQVDAATEPLLDTIRRAIGLGDDGALRAIMSLFSARGLVIRAAQQIAPDLLPKPGVLSARRPAASHLQDALEGWQVLARQGVADSGQACVIAHGRAVAHEGDAGTDAMLRALGTLQGGILFKGPKPGQDRRIDLPTIGARTVAAVAAAGLDGIIVEAGGVLILDVADVAHACDDAGLFLLVVAHP